MPIKPVALYVNRFTPDTASVASYAISPSFPNLPFPHQKTRNLYSSTTDHIGKKISEED